MNKYQVQAIEEFKKGKVEYRADKTGIVHLPFGKADFSEEDLLVNFLAAVVSCGTRFNLSHIYWNMFVILFRVRNALNRSHFEPQKSVETNKPSGAKGVYWKSAHICSSMGPSIRLNIRDMLDYKPTWNALRERERESICKVFCSFWGACSSC